MSRAGRRGSLRGFLSVFVSFAMVLGSLVLPVPQVAAAADNSYVMQWGSRGSGDGQFYYPWGVAVDPSSGDVYVADPGNFRIQRFTSDGTYVTKWGQFGFGEGSFATVVGIAVDSLGDVYVADPNTDRIQKFTKDGAFIAAWGAPGSGEFQSPVDVAIDPVTDEVYVVDSGLAQGTTQNGHPCVKKFTREGVFLGEWGGSGHGDGQFDLPVFAAVDSAHNVYVSDNWRHDVQKFTSDGTFVTKWGEYGYGAGQFQGVQGIDVDSAGIVFVADADRVQLFSGDGTYLTEGGSQGEGDGQFNQIKEIALDAAGDVFATDCANNRIQKLHIVSPPPVAYDGSAETGVDTPVLISLVGSDPNGDPLTYSIVGGPANGSLGGLVGNQVLYTPAPGYSGADSFTFRVNDGVLDSNVARIAITVRAANRAPVALDDFMTIAEDTPITFPATDLLPNDTDPDGDELKVTSVQSNPLYVHGTVVMDGNGMITFTPEADYNGPAAFRYNITDGHGGTGWARVRITVAPVNDAPVAVDDTRTIAEDTSITFPATDLLPNDTDVDGDALTVTGVLFNPLYVHGTVVMDGNGMITYTPDPDYSGTGAFRYNISDGHGGTSWARVYVTIDPVNDAPEVRVTLPDVVVGEGAVAANLGSFLDTEGDPVTLVASVGEVASSGSVWSWTFQTADGPSESRTVQVAATDSGGATGEASFNLVVKNRPPTITSLSGPIDPAQAGTPVALTGDFTDPGTDDTHTAVWEWGDGTTSAGAVTETNGSGSVAGAHAYTAAGVYSVRLTVTDKDGASDSETCSTWTVIYDPGAGFVTGGGWINSPAGAMPSNPTLVGKANFGFVSKYLPGRSTPSGQTEFQFKAGNLNFHSESYDWLVVGAYKAQYKGTGTINGAGEYRFILTAIDGRKPGGGGVDKFRIRIWDESDGGLVYDNQMNDPDGADPTTLLLSGSIQIHKS